MKKWRDKNTLSVALLIMAVAACLITSSDAMAGEKTATQQVASKKQLQKNIELETITVTAEKREENIQDVPVSVTALSKMQIEDAGITHIEELSTYIPNLFIEQFGPRGSGEIHPITRGIGSLLGKSSVGFYVDDVSYIDGVSFNMTGFFDIERIEFLRGPQGTLYGRNALGGVINIITKKPTNDVRAWGGLSFGNYSYQKYHVGLNTPVIKDKLFFSLSGLHSKRDGFIKNDLTGKGVDSRKGYSGRAKLRWIPTDSLDVTLGISGDQIRDGGYALGSLEQIRENPHHVNHDFTDAYSDADQTREDLRIVYDTPWLTVTSITGLLQHSLKSVNDQDFTPNDFFINNYKKDTDQITQEFRLASPEDQDSSLKWISGVYLYRHKIENDFDNTMRPDAFDFFSGGALSQLGIEIESDDLLKGDVKMNGAALFGQATYTFLDKLDLTLGLRYEYEESEAKLKGDRTVSLSGAGVSFLPVLMSDPAMGPTLAQFLYAGPTSDIDEEVDYSEWLPKFTVAYHLNDQIMTYVSVAKGFRSGGFNIYVQGNNDTSDLVYDPERSWNYELGVKSGWFNNRLIANAAVFYIDYENQQVLQLLGSSQSITKNAGESTSKGFEVELTGKPLQGLELTANCGYTDTKFDKYRDPLAAAIYDGNKTSMVPQYDYLLAAQYRRSLTDSINIFGRVELHGTGDIYWDYANTEKQDAYEIVNARLGAEFEHFDIYLWAKNLFEEEYEDIAFEFPMLGWIGQSGDPRTVGITLTGRF